MQDCDQENRPTMQGEGRPMAMCEATEERGTSMDRKAELFKLAQAIASQVSAMTKRRERCLLRQFVEALLD